MIKNKSIQQILFSLIIVFVSSCSNNRKVDNYDRNLSTIKQFDDAKEILKEWSHINTVIVHIISEPDNLHPTNGNSNPRSEILQYTQKPLLNIDYKNQGLSPGLVKSMPEISNDGLRYTYALRDDVKWDDGSPLTPMDVLFTAKVFLCPLTNDQAVRLYWENLSNILIDSLEPGKFTLVMKRKHIQNISFLTGFSILQHTFHDPKNVLASFTIKQFEDTSFDAQSFQNLVQWSKEFNDDSIGREPSKLNGLGMYKVTDWENGQYITIEKKINHWTSRSHDYHEVAFPDKIIFKLNKDEASQQLEFKAQTYDLSTNLSVSTFLQLANEIDVQKNFNQAMMPVYNYTYICINEKPDGKNHKYIFNDVNVRHALALLTPVNDIIRLVYKEFGDQCRRMTSNVSPLKKEVYSNLKEIPFDVKEASHILLNAGWRDSNGDGIIDKVIDGEVVNMSADLNYLTSSQEWKNIASLIAEQMAKAGVQINPVGMDLKLFIEKAKSHDFDLMLGSWGGTSLSEDYTQLWHTSSYINHGSNYSGFGNDETDAIIDSIKYELDDSKRELLSHKLQTKIYNDQPYIFLYSSMRRNIIHKRFGNQMLFSEKPGILINMLKILSVNNGVTMKDEAVP